MGMLLLLLGGVAALVALGWRGSTRALHPDRQFEAYVPEEVDLPVQEVEFASRDGTPLAGWFLPGDKGPALALLHGYGRSRAELLPHAAFLHRAGYSVLLFDFRHRGRSGGDRVTLGAREPLDVLGAVDYLRGRPEVDAGRVGILGVSLGAASGIVAATADPEIRAVVAESAFHNLKSVVDRGVQAFLGLPPFPFATIIRFFTQRRLDTRIDAIAPDEVIDRISPRAVFIIHSLKDDGVPFQAAQVLYWRASQPKRLWFVPGADHARAYQADPAEYQQRVLAFLEKYL
ncbi:MAG: alpha/beta hydrolase [Dehalococcoidia bacterium]